MCALERLHDQADQRRWRGRLHLIAAALRIRHGADLLLDVVGGSISTTLPSPRDCGGSRLPFG
jgi:hypothetical protein